MIRVLILLLLPFAAQAETLRVANFNTELSRKGPGILLRDIQRADPQVNAVIEVMAATRPDIIALQGLDWDLDGLALAALAEALNDRGLNYPHSFTAQPNSGVETGLDLDGDGKTGGPGDAQGWGRFTGQNGLAVLSRYPIETDKVQSFSEMLWQDLPGATLPTVKREPFPSGQAQSVQRLSSTAHWIIPIDAPGGRIDLMTFHASPPVFDGPEDRNGLRNRDEIRFWSLLLNGDLGPFSSHRFIIAGDANLDPHRGEGHKPAIRNLIANPLIQDPMPVDPAGSASTVAWKGVGEMRVDYVLPSADWRVLDAGIYWPETEARDVAETASRHRLVWVDLYDD
ncbi:Endonuclease/Exonuclease/phosphatase family protein [Ruegeria halocynthiae]|uniref:Endonuclease/Exonuclease/phosphatase family protein n=1 Tax=Ruegeria halocynthiae TaxID=985054 RepID=A0A1H3DP86_9RHOB|nr:endonuclease/exonuclease/phosphatase family protein [Ruegeria halocynthiae]SDX68140.1 Endonuclease/Exonuclease/phosphatase family protein [Ruegeria halocynthiae]